MSQRRAKEPDAGKHWRQEDKGMTEDEMVGWYHWLDGHKFEQTLGAGDGQGSLVCCSLWGHKDLEMTEEWVVPQLLEWSFYSLAYEIIQLAKNIPHSMAATLTLCNGPHPLCAMCFSLSKLTSYLFLCLSLNSFCDKTSRTWASLRPETRCCDLVGRLKILAEFESQPCGFKS